MVRRQISVQDDNAFTASGVIKGKRITVSRVPAISQQELINGRRHLGNLFLQSSGSVFLDVPASTITTPTQVAGSLTPGTFRADGFGVEVLFQVGIVKHVAKGRTGKLDITHIEVGLKHVDGEAWQVGKPVGIDDLSRPGLLRLAIQASRCVGMAFPIGWIIDGDGESLGQYAVGDLLPIGSWIGYGIRKVKVVDSITRQQELVEVDTVCEVVLWDSGEVLNETAVRLLTGGKQAGRKQERGSASDPKVLRIVAKLYNEAHHNSNGLRIPEYVRRELLEKHGISNGESWVRSMGVRARKEGLLKQGKRKARK